MQIASVPPEKALDLWLKLLHEAGSTVRVTLGLSSGAVVLFVRLLVEPGQPIVAMILIAGSVLCFGAAAVLCLGILVGFLNGQTIMAGAAVDTTGRKLQTIGHYLDRWTRSLTLRATAMQVLFYLGVLLAVAFVVTMCGARIWSVYTAS